jgi:hypothetical protein
MKIKLNRRTCSSGEKENIIFKKREKRRCLKDELRTNKNTPKQKLCGIRKEEKQYKK